MNHCKEKFALSEDKQLKNNQGPIGPGRQAP